MELKKLTDRAKQIRQLYANLEIKKYGREWTPQEIVQGFIGDVGDLVKLVMAKEGIRETEKVDEKLQHELADCLWAILVLAEKYGINLEESFLKTMAGLEQKIKKELL